MPRSKFTHDIRYHNKITKNPIIENKAFNQLKQSQSVGLNQRNGKTIAAHNLVIKDLAEHLAFKLNSNFKIAQSIADFEKGF